MTVSSEFISFADGVERIEAGFKRSGSEKRSGIVTSRDPGIDAVVNELKLKSMPSGFQKWQLPVYFSSTEGAQFFVTQADPAAKVDEHAHDNGDAMRFIASGSINYEGIELSAGDWMFIPKDVPYSFTAGKYGATMFYCYPCCCVNAAEMR